VDHIVATSPQYAASSSTLRRYMYKTSVIPIGIDDEYQPSLECTTLAQQWRGKLPERVFLFIGKFRDYKGLIYLLEAALRTGYPVVLVGDGDEQEALKQQAIKLGLDKVVFIGSVSDEDKSALLDLCYAFVFPSHLRAEAFGVSLLEAAMHEKAMISCDIGTGTSYVNRYDDTGITVPGADADGLTTAMTRLWASPELTAKFGTNARK